MASIVWVVALLIATLALGGCAGIPYGALGNALGGGGYAGGYGGGMAAATAGWLSAGATRLPAGCLSRSRWTRGMGAAMLRRLSPITSKTLMGTTMDTSWNQDPQAGWQGQGYPGHHQQQWSQGDRAAAADTRRLVSRQGSPPGRSPRRKASVDGSSRTASRPR